MKWDEIKAEAAKILSIQEEHWGYLCSFNEDEWKKIAAVVDAAILYQNRYNSDCTNKEMIEAEDELQRAVEELEK